MNRIIIDGVDVTEELNELTRKKRGEKAQATTRKTWDFTGGALKLMNLHADINIQPSRSTAITVEAIGPTDMIEKLSVAEGTGVVTIRGTGHNGGGGVQINTSGSSFNFVNGATVVTMGKNVIINNQGGSGEKITLNITAPTQVDIDADISGNLTIGDLECYLDVEMTNTGTLRASTVKELAFDANGSCQAFIDVILGGDVDIDVSGSCSANITRGNIRKLSIDASGASHVKVNATAERADLDASGASSIDVKSVTGRCRKDSSGVSQIHVG